MRDTPFSPWPSYTQKEAEAVVRTLLSNRVNYWTGTECREFEAEFASWVGTKYAVAVTNGTFALEAALRAADIGAGDEVIVTPRSFMASASCAVSVGARPIFADVDWDSGNLTAETIREVLTSRTRAIICVHLSGRPCEMDPIMALAADRDLTVIEDCSQAHGAKYRGRMVGSIGDIGTWSFCQDKIMTTGGEGGMVTTNDRGLWSRMWSDKDHGKSWEAVYEREHGPGFRWLHESFGTNGRMLEMQAVIGRIQLRRMPQWNAARRQNAARLAAACAESRAIRMPPVPGDMEHAYYRFGVFVEPENLADGWDRDRIIEEITSTGVPCYQGSCSEIYLEKAFASASLQPSSPLPVARRLGETSLTFLVHPTLTGSELEHTCRSMLDVFSRASR